MLKASRVEILLSLSDLEQAMSEFAAEQVEHTSLSLLEGALLITHQMDRNWLPSSVQVQLRLEVLRLSGTIVEFQVSWPNLQMVPNFVKERVLEKAMASLPGQYSNGVLALDLAEQLENFPIAFAIVDMRIRRDGIRISLADLVAFPLIPDVLVEPPSLLPVPASEEAQIPEHQGYYQKLRAKVKEFAQKKAPKWAQPLLPWVLAVPDFFVLLVRLVRDERVPTGVKVLLGAVIAYFISPVDLIPDALPIIGEIDDLAVALFALEHAARHIPAGLIQEAWPGEGDVQQLIKEGIRLFTKVLPQQLRTAIQRLIVRAQRP